MKEKEPMSMEEWADKITDKLEKQYGAVNYVRGDYDPGVLWYIVFDTICLFQGLKEEKEENAKERYQEIKLEKERQEGK